MILSARGGRCYKMDAFRKALEHNYSPCVMNHGGRDAAPLSTARGRATRSRPARRLASAAKKTVARWPLLHVGQSARRRQSDASLWLVVAARSGSEFLCSGSPTSQKNS